MAMQAWVPLFIHHCKYTFFSYLWDHVIVLGICVDEMCMAVIYAVPLVQPEDMCCPREKGPTW